MEDVFYKWLWAPVIGLITVVFGVILNNRRAETNELFNRLRGVEQDVVRLEAEIKPMAKSIDEMNKKMDNLLEIVIEIRVQAAKNAKSGTQTYIQDT